MSEMKDQIFQEDETCPSVGYQAVSVCVPVTVKPFAKTSATTTRCCGGPIIRPGKDTCSGVKNGSCSFTIGQNIVVAIPVAFGAVATVGDTFVDCLDASAEEFDCDTIAALGEVAVATPEAPVASESKTAL